MWYHGNPVSGHRYADHQRQCRINKHESLHCSYSRIRDPWFSLMRQATRGYVDRGPPSHLLLKYHSCLSRYRFVVVVATAVAVDEDAEMIIHVLLYIIKPSILSHRSNPDCLLQKSPVFRYYSSDMLLSESELLIRRYPGLRVPVRCNRLFALLMNSPNIRKSKSRR